MLLCLVKLSGLFVIAVMFNSVQVTTDVLSLFLNCCYGKEFQFSLQGIKYIKLVAVFSSWN